MQFSQKQIIVQVPRVGLGPRAVTETSLPREQTVCAEHALWGLPVCHGEGSNGWLVPH